MKLVLLSLGVAACSAHNWLKVPATRNGNKASTAKPCAAAKAGYAGIVVGKGANIAADWTTNHGGSHWFKIVKAADIATLETTAPKVPAKSLVVAPTEEGKYIMQYGWSKYRNCVDVEVKAGAAMGPPPARAPNAAPAPTQAAGPTNAPAPTAPTAPNAAPAPPVPALNDVNCGSYCTDIMSECTGAMQQFVSKSDCLGQCAQFSASGQEGDKIGNTIQCRWYHLHAEKADNSEHCAHAGRAGGGAGYCVGTEAANPGVSFQVVAKNTNGAAIVALMEEALKAGGFTDCHNILDPILDGEANWNVLVTFCDGGSEHAASPSDLAASLLSATGSAPVLDHLKNSGAVDTAVVNVYNVEGSESTAASAQCGLPVLAAAAVLLL